MSQTQLPMPGFDPDPGPAPKGQKAFDKLVAQIRAARERLAAWSTAIPSYQHQYATELLPLHNTWRGLQIRLVHRLDRACAQKKGLSQSERHRAADLIIELTGSLLAERDDKDLKVLYERHSGISYDDNQKDAFDLFKSVMEDAFGVDLSDTDDSDTPEDLFRHAQARRAHIDPECEEAPQAAPKLSAKKQADHHQILQSIRTLYRKLASALHPDREHDPKERDRKTALMQQVNSAYEKNKLLPLLELTQQLARDQGALSPMSENQVKIYTKALKSDLAEVQQEVAAVEDAFRAQFGLDPTSPLSPRAILRELTADIAETQRTIADMENDLQAFEDIRHLKGWLRTLRYRPHMMDPDIGF